MCRDCCLGVRVLTFLMSLPGNCSLFLSLHGKEGFAMNFGWWTQFRSQTFEVLVGSFVVAGKHIL